MLSIFLSTIYPTSSLFCGINAISLLIQSSVNPYINSFYMIAKRPHFRNMGNSNKIYIFHFPW